MNLRWLDCFFALAKELHFGRAAATLFIGQSTLSESIRNLEDHLGGRLFDRSSRRVELSDFGRRALESLQPVCLELVSTVDRCRAMNSGEKVPFTIGFLGGGLYELHQPFVREFAEEFPEVALSFTELNYRTHFSALADGDVDLAICRLPLGASGLTSGPVVLRDQRVLCVQSGHPLAERTLVDPEELAELKMCRIPPESTDVGWQDYHFPRTTPSGTPIASGPTITTIREGIAAVSAGEGSLMITKRAVDYYGTPNVDFVAIDLPSMPSALVRRTNDHRPILAKVDALLYKIAQRFGTAPVPDVGVGYESAGAV
ncbi:LysR family transcriptional regulator [Rhodococcus sp. AG1013]|uniref:LysR family transcriptional regulator n=1 Tax=unclassified Rhodococcus (in: high G+C Gram-positive bacteria) TaxID=192944 RepID=UPI000E0AA780|nr:LysR family transcriptional regulator [Rhodococcus sp. AG1013]RDI28164.1 LysR family transcriptional regulator [Rhodococcus sp. AG1013]